MFRAFRVPLVISGAIIVLTYLLGGTTAAITVLILSLLEITFSFDNAIVNANILKRMSPYWQKMFLTVGILIAVFGMRLLFPLIIVAISGHLNPIEALRLAISDPHAYAIHIQDAHAAVAAFGGTFLLMLFLDWLTEEREIRWLRPLESFMVRIGKLEGLTVIIAAVTLLIFSQLFDGTTVLLTSGVLGMVTYLLVSSIDQFFNETSVMSVAKAGFATFMYLEVLDASFSFDGVIGAFAVTDNIFYIAIGLGIGALFIRSMTVYLTQNQLLNDYRYLEHGAHWAIGSLAILLLVTIKYDISDVVSGLIGISFIGLALATSIYENRKGVNNALQ